jgi:hypothetical protein
MIRIVGTVSAKESASTVDYRIELMPAALLALAVSAVAAIPIFVAWSLLGYSIVPMVLLLIVAIIVTGSINLWISERQAGWLRDYVASTLDARPVV